MHAPFYHLMHGHFNFSRCLDLVDWNDGMEQWNGIVERWNEHVHDENVRPEYAPARITLHGPYNYRVILAMLSVCKL